MHTHVCTLAHTYTHTQGKKCQLPSAYKFRQGISVCFHLSLSSSSLSMSYHCLARRNPQKAEPRARGPTRLASYVQVGKPPAAQTVPPGMPKQLFRSGSEQKPCHMLLFINSLRQGTKE